MCFVCLLLFNVSLNMDAAGGIINLCNLTRQEAKATMKFQRIIGVTSGGRGAMALLGF